jgi:hypothetical protein
VFVIDSKQRTGQVNQTSDGLVWHNHYRLDRTLATVRWEAEALGRLLGYQSGESEYASSARDTANSPGISVTRSPAARRRPRPGGACC